MRPNQLTLTAFGPYHQTEVIDFDALSPHNLFVVSGNTGAGKTSIFDGISYALFGGASGEDRKDVSSLRSDFADDSLPTSVTLVFTLQGKHYRVFRQLPYLKAGNKSQTPGKAEIYEIIEGEEVSIVDRQITQDVDKKILSLIGLNREQFNQLILLPQGEHQRFLTSKTDEKEAILRTLFNTEKYRALIDSLKIKHDEQQKTVLQLTAKNSAELSSIFKQLPARDVELFTCIDDNGVVNINHHQAITGLMIEKTHYSATITASNEKITADNTTLMALHKEFAQAEALNQQFERLAKNQEALAKHIASEADISEVAQSIQFAERAQPIEKYFDEVNRLRTDAKAVLATLNSVKEAHQKSQQQLTVLKANLDAENSKTEAREQLQREINRLEDNETAVKSLATQKASLTQLQKDLAVITAKITEATQLQNDLKVQKTELTAQLQAVDKVVETNLPLMRLAPLFQLLQKIIQKRDQLNVNHEKATVEKLNAESLLKDAKSNFDTALKNWRDNQANLLASTLTWGKPCPVCGSKEHPAHALMDDLFTSVDDNETNAQNLEAEFSEAQTALMQAEATMSEITQQLKHLSTEQKENATEQKALFAKIEKFYQSDDYGLLKTLEIPMVNGDILQHELDALLLKVETASAKAEKAHKDAEVHKHKLTQLEQTLSVKNDQLLVDKEAHTQQNSELIRQQTALDLALKNIPEELQNFDAFMQKLRTQQASLQGMKTAFEHAEKNHKAEEHNFIALKNQLMNEDAQYQKLVKAGKEAKESLDQTLEKANFADESAFLQARIEPEQLKSLREKIATYHQEKALLMQKIEDATAQLKDKTPINLDAFRENLQTKEIALNQRRTELTQNTGYLNVIQNLLDELANNHSKIEKKTKHLNKLAEVYQLLRGNNSLKLSFERYILIEYFERVIESANLRLQKMTNGQFEFMRSEDLASGGKQSGLDLDIYDAYTGEARNVKTLSGGEKFKASLSLSLGMADVIQAHQGGITIDTLFIDEGFGSLDEESLLQAVDTLIELQASGRMIGIISHVEELKQTLPARIEVTKTKGGYSKTAVVVR